MGDAPTGLEQMRHLLEHGPRPGIAESLNFHLVDVGDGFALFEGTPGRHAYNPIGSVHGGYAATLLDSACGCAVHSRLTADQAYTTLELKIAYHRAMTDQTGRVTCRGEVVSLGRRAAFAEARIHDADGRLIASATSTLLVMSQ